MATKQYFELGDKFWEVWTDGSDLYTRHGKVGANGQVKIKNLATAAAARAQQTKVIADKTKEGYAKPDGAKPAKPAPAAEAPVELPAGTQRLELGEGAARKFWQIRRDARKVIVQSGKVGTKGKTQVKTYSTEWDARWAVTHQLGEKKLEGYQLVLTGAAAAASPAHSNPALEKAILAHPESDDGFMVYADWLQQQGDIRGELAVIQTQLARAPKHEKLKAAEQKWLWDHRVHFWGRLAPYVTKQQALPRPDPKTADVAVAASWRQGFIDVLELSAYNSWGDDAAPPVHAVDELLRRLPEVASARFVRELTIAKPVVSGQYSFASAIEALANVLPALPMLRRLTLGKFDAEDSELSWSHMGTLDALWPLLKHLEYLKIKAGSMTLGKLDLPALRELRIETGGLTRKSIASIVTGRMPALETLNLWLGQPNYGGNARLADLLPLIDKKTFPKVKHLGIANTILGDELAAHWPTATILPQLVTLDLSRSHLTITGMRLLAEHAGAFAHLEALDVSECLLDREGVKLAKTLCQNVNVKGQIDPAEYAPEEDDDEQFYRYTAVGE